MSKAISAYSTNHKQFYMMTSIENVYAYCSNLPKSSNIRRMTRAVFYKRTTLFYILQCFKRSLSNKKTPPKMLFLLLFFGKEIGLFYVFYKVFIYTIYTLSFSFLCSFIPFLLLSWVLCSQSLSNTGTNTAKSFDYNNLYVLRFGKKENIVEHFVERPKEVV